MSEAGTWRRCSACKGPIALSSTYWVCNVSTCNRKRTALAFCTVSCWEVHLPIANHRDSWAEEKTAPATPEPELQSKPAPEARDTGSGGTRRLVRPEPQSKPAPEARDTGSGGTRRLVRPEPTKPVAKPDIPEEVLIIASRLKDYVKARSGYNTSDRVLEPLSEIVREVCDRAIENASRDGRKTILDRDVPKR